MILLDAPPMERDMLRLRNEYLEMPGLCVTVSQAARLFGVRTDHAAEMLEALVREDFLFRDGDGNYRRHP